MAGMENQIYFLLNSVNFIIQLFYLFFNSHEMYTLYLQDEHNSCPICRYELQTDDLEYELKKEREKEAEEERKGAANAIRGGEYMYV